MNTINTIHAIRPLTSGTLQKSPSQKPPVSTHATAGLPLLTNTARTVRVASSAHMTRPAGISEDEAKKLFGWFMKPEPVERTRKEMNDIIALEKSGKHDAANDAIVRLQTRLRYYATKRVQNRAWDTAPTIKQIIQRRTRKQSNVPAMVAIVNDIKHFILPLANMGRQTSPQLFETLLSGTKALYYTQGTSQEKAFIKDTLYTLYSDARRFYNRTIPNIELIVQQRAHA